MSGNEIGVVVFGAGRWGRNHLRCLASLGALRALVDPDPATRAAAAETWKVPAFANERELEAAGLELQAAVIATPAETHSQVGLRALELGLDLLVEKPLALSVEDAEFLLAEAERRDRILMTGHLLLYHPAVEALKALIDAGELGEIRYVYSNRLNLGRVRREENILWSFAPHDVAAILHLLGALPVEVRATGGHWLQHGVADVTLTHMVFPGGQQAHVFVSWLHPFKEQRLVVVGSEKMAVFDDLRREARLVVIDSGVELDHDGRALERRGEERVLPIATTEPLLAECRHFIDCCRDRRRPLTDGHHGLDVLRVLAAAESGLPRPTRAPRLEDLRHDRSAGA
ncbi:MAG: Gfo/Idh/MocA family oxidoreductase [Planctomycetes bacterium]|nr:Gfo/Idh/MocA family oxidoreductase [Planctomycetota bacterium]